LSAEGSQILTLTLDVALKLRYLGETIIFACEEPRPQRQYAINLLTSTILDMEINFGKGALKEKVSIDLMLDSLWHSPTLCPDNSTTNSTNSTQTGLTPSLVTNLMGNVTVSLFSSMGITPTQGNLSRFSSRKLLMMYVGLLGFVYMYYFISVALAMMHFSAFAFLTRRHLLPLHNAIAVGIRLGFGLLLLGLVAFAQNFNLTYFFMTSPMISFVFALALSAGKFAVFCSCCSLLIKMQFLLSIGFWTGSGVGRRAISSDMAPRVVLYQWLGWKSNLVPLRSKISTRKGLEEDYQVEIRNDRWTEM
jgi:hypothetical protein